MPSYILNIEDLDAMRVETVVQIVEEPCLSSCTLTTGYDLADSPSYQRTLVYSE